MSASSHRDPPAYLPRVLSRWGVASRKAAENWVRAGRVEVNGQVIRDVLWLVHPGRDRVSVDGNAVGARSVGQWILLNKPRGAVTTTRDERGRLTVMDLLGPQPDRVVPVGRLDRASSGLLLFTDDHRLADRLLAPDSHVEKSYRVKIGAVLTDPELETLRAACVTADGEKLGAMTVALESRGERTSWLRVGLREGRNRQIRRRIEALGHEIEHLIRVSFGPIELGTIAPGCWRPLRSSEVQSLRDAVRDRGVRPHD